MVQASFMGFGRRRSLFLTCTLGWFSILIDRLGYIISSLLCMSLPTIHLVLNHMPPCYSETRWRVEDRHQRLIEGSVCLPAMYPNPPQVRSALLPSCAGNTRAQKLSTSECYQGWGNMQREEYMCPDTVGDPQVFQGC